MVAVRAFAAGLVFTVVVVYEWSAFLENWFSCFFAASYTVPSVVVYADRE